MMEKGLEGTRLDAPKPCSVNLLARAHCAESVYADAKDFIRWFP